MEYYYIYGLRRSGNHAIMEWILNNKCGDSESKNPEWICDHRIKTNRKNIIYYNDITSKPDTHPGWKTTWQSTYHSTYKNFSFQYFSVEEQYISPYSTEFCDSNKFSKQVVQIFIIRDIFNLISSRKKMMGCFSELAMKYYLDMYKEYKNQYRTDPDNTLLINYDKWLVDGDYRQEIADRLKLETNNENNVISEVGGGSSFKTKQVDKMGLLTRYRSESEEYILNCLNKEVLEITRDNFYGICDEMDRDIDLISIHLINYLDQKDKPPL